MRLWCALIVMLVASWNAVAAPTLPAESFQDTLRGSTPLNEEPKPPRMPPTYNKDIRVGRAYPQQPPVIPHAIDKYQLDKNANGCMKCHAASKAAESGAVPVGISHYQNREDMTLGHLSNRRYFCTQCHVSQADIKPLVNNTFLGMQDVKLPAKPASAKK
jgi:nitrate reductase (cytochrome), electron transfer subunit